MVLALPVDEARTDALHQRPLLAYLPQLGCSIRTDLPGFMNVVRDDKILR